MKNRWLWTIFGIVSILGGLFVLMNPLVATIAAERIPGYLFFFAGIGWVISTFREKTWGAKIWSLLSGIAMIWLGISLLAHPLAGVLSLTIVVAIVFFVQGVAKILIAFSFRGTQGFLVLLISGALSIVLALMILSNFPQSAVQVLGILLAIELISNGISMIFISRSAKSAGQANAA